MAATLVGARLTEAHRLVQARLSAQAAARLLRSWSLLDLAALDRTTEAWLVASTAIVAEQRATSERIARAYQQQFRAVELAAPVTATAVGPGTALPVGALATSITVEGPIRLKSLIAAGLPLEVASASAARSAAAVGARHVLDGGRSIIDTSTAIDPAAHGARRVTSGGCCAYCAMLAARSYDGLSSAQFRAHPGCHCQPETAFTTGAQDATRQAQEFAALYHQHADGVGGGGSKKLNAFRRALAAQRQA